MKGYALLVGVNTLDTTHYAGDRYFADAFDDIPVISDILNDVGIFHRDNIDILIDQDYKPDNGAPLFNSDALTNNPILKPTADNFLKIIEERYIKNTTSEEGFLVIFFSGHGTSVDVKKKESEISENDEDTKEKRQLLCFQDRMLLENEMRKYLTRIPKKFKVFFVVNACYSGGLSQAKFNLINWRHIFNTQLEPLDPTKAISKRKGNKVLLNEIQELGTLLFANENLLLNRYVTDAILRSKVIEATLQNHNNYADKIAEFSEDFMDYSTDLCYLFSCDKDQKTEIGFPDEPSYFPKLLKKVWNEYKDHNITYRQFEGFLRRSAKKYIQPQLDPFPKGQRTIFDASYPFYYTDRPDLAPFSSNTKLQTMATLNLTPVLDATPPHVKMTVSGKRFDIVEAMCINYNLPDDIGTPHLDTILSNSEIGNLTGIDFISSIEVRESTHSDFPTAVPNMEIVDWEENDNTEDGNAVVILYDTMANKIKGRKRTNGKVSNSQD